MGKDLYYKKTPPKVEEENSLGGVYHQTWGLLANIYTEGHRHELEGKELTESNIRDLEIISNTAQTLNNQNVITDMQELISAIKEHKSITLEIKS